MADAEIPFLWLCGPSGVGKSAVGFAIFTQLQTAGIRCAYVDADQLGLCYPAPADDPDTHRAKANGLGAVWPAYRAAGARCLILSGGVGTSDIVDTYAAKVPGTALTLCRLRVGHDELRERFLRRGWTPDLVERAVSEAEALERSGVGDVCVDTDGLGVAEVARLVRDRAGRWPGG